jgi:DNA-directed RNA polymerase sigma subunit (sigma70/sigma32)
VASGRSDVKAWKAGNAEGERFRPEVRLDATVEEGGVDNYDRYCGIDASPEAKLIELQEQQGAIDAVRSFGERYTGREAVVFQNMLQEEPRSLAALGRELGITKQRVGQIAKAIRDEMESLGEEAFAA